VCIQVQAVTVAEAEIIWAKVGIFVGMKTTTELSMTAGKGA
jgi:hypothetical protein